MTTIMLEQTTLADGVRIAQQERVMITSHGKPVALLIGIEGLDEEQWQLGSSETFWTWITNRRAQRTLSREQLERQLSPDSNLRSRKV